MKRITSLAAALMTALIFTLSGCSAGISVKAKADKSTSLEFSASMGKTIGSMLQAISGSSDLSSLMSKDDVKAAVKDTVLSDAEASVSPSSFSLKGNVKASELQAEESVSSLIQCTDRTLTVSITPELLLNSYNSMPEDSMYYLDLFMAPVFTEEKLSESEWLDLVGAFYGDEMREELSSAAITLSMYCPDGKTVKTASGGSESTSGAKIKASVSSGKAVFSIPLSHLLTLDEKETFTIGF